MPESNLMQQLSHLQDYLGHHLLLTATALGIGLVICVPLGVLVTRVKYLQWPTLMFASVMQTIPGIALLALMVPILGMIGFLPALIALVLYSMLPILRNTVTGILGVDAAIVEAATAIGMTRTQMLSAVELPLAAPVIVAGIRTATVWVVGTATLATPVGATSLGNYIFSGLQTQNSTAVIVGCVAAAFLAITLDQIIRLAEVGVTQGNRRKLYLAILLLATILYAGLSPLLADKNNRSDSVVVGAKTFTEQYILAELLASTLKGTDLSVQTKTSMGSTILFDALAAGDIDLYVDYSGTIWANIMKRTDSPPRAEMLQQMEEWLWKNRGIHLLGTLGFENTYALALSKEKAARHGIRSMEDLARDAPGFLIGSDYEFFNRPEWKTLNAKYQLRFANQIMLDPSLLYGAIRAGKVDVISSYSTDGRIVEYDLVVLDDPLQALPRYDAVLLLSRKAFGRDDIQRSLAPLLDRISNDVMRRANMLVDIEGKSVPEAAYALQTWIDHAVE